MLGYLRESTERMLQMALKEKVLVGEKNPQDYQKKEEKVRNRRKKPYMESLLGKLQVAEDEFSWLRNKFIKKGTELILAA